MAYLASSHLAPCNRCFLRVTTGVNRLTCKSTPGSMSLGRCFYSMTFRSDPTSYVPKNLYQNMLFSTCRPYQLYHKNVSLLQAVRFSRQCCSTQTPVRTIAKQSSGKVASDDRDWVRPEGLDTGISLFNSITRKKEPLILPNGRLATWYACGPTVYDHAHIGHASSYVRTDLMRRILVNLFNVDVVMVMGITDIDDKIIKRSAELNVSMQDLARLYEKEFRQNMEDLNVTPPTIQTRVTEHINSIIHFTQRLINNGMAYRTPSGCVYFDVQQYGRYGRLWTHSMDTNIRETADKEKRSARDFALWKAAKPGEPSWVSPWGKGRPGWHIECSTMASSIFGEKLDIHSGGMDLKFPHHENEMAQSEACFCTNQWTNYWIHTGSLHPKSDEQKMSKSLKNTISVSEFLEKYTANQFRMFCMLRPYRQVIEYSDEAMIKPIHIHSHWVSFLNSAEAYINGKLTCLPINEAFLMESLENTKIGVEQALADDFDTAKAVQIIEELVHRANVQLGRKPENEVRFGARSPGVIAAVVAYVERVMDIFGIQASKKKALKDSPLEQQVLNVMDNVVKFRGHVRKFALEENIESDDTELSQKQRRSIQMKRMKPILEACDELRDGLRSDGLQIHDHDNESTWGVIEHKALPPKNPGSKKP